MASTVTARRRLNFGTLNGEILTLDITSYPTGGEAITKANVGLPANPVAVFAISSETLDEIFRWDAANNKLIVGVASTGAQVANTTDIGTVVLLVLYEGA